MSLLPKNVRTRLTLWYVLAFAIILIFYAGLFMTLVFVNLRSNLDDQLEQDYEIIENLMEVKPNGSIQVESEDDPYFHEKWFQIWSSNWKLLYESRPFTSKDLSSISETEKTENGFHFRSQRLDNSIRIRILSGKINIEGKWLFIRLVRNEENLWHELNGFIRLMLIALPMAILIAGFGGYFLTKKLLSPIDDMSAKAHKIGVNNLKDRLTVNNPHDELGKLAGVFNEMLERIQKSFERLRHFTSDAAHELRTPLTAIRSMGEVSLQNNKGTGYYREIIGSILEENNRLTHLVDNLLFLSRADSQAISKDIGKFELNSFTHDVVEFIHPLAEEKNQTIIIQNIKMVNITADKALLKQALLNILDNAIKYSQKNTEIFVNIDLPESNLALVEIEDRGPGIAAEHLTKIFERFYVVNKGRSREMGGSGLGLAIAHWAITAQGGTITVASDSGRGSSFKIFLPVKENNVIDNKEMKTTN